MKLIKLVFFCLIFTVVVLICAGTKPRQKINATNEAGHNNRKESGPSQSSTPSTKFYFDYFALAVSWLPGQSYKLQTEGSRIRAALQPEWTIHGLWPQMFHAKRPPSQCFRKDVSFEADRLRASGFMTRLEKSWYSIVTNKSNADFWRHEFNKHGCCAIRSEAITKRKEASDDVKYFAATLELFEKFELDTVLSDYKYKAGDVRKLRDIIKIFQSKVGHKVVVKTFRNYASNEIYLTEVYICFEISLEPRHCPQPDPSDEALNSDVIYLDQLVSQHHQPPKDLPLREDL